MKYLECLSWIILYLPFIGSEYTYFGDKIFFPEAVMECEKLGQRLVTMDTREKYNNLKNFFDILFNTVPRQEPWLGIRWDSEYKQYRWLTGELLPAAEWCDAPDFRNDHQACAVWNGGCMKAILCTSTKDFVCLNTNNSDGYIIGKQNNYFPAKKICEDNGGHLPIIRTKAELQFFANFVSNHDLGKENWLGGEEVEDDVMKWLTGEDLPYHVWWDPYPTSHVDNSEIHIHTKEFKFHTSDNRKRAYVCETVVEPSPDHYYEHVGDTMVSLALPIQQHLVSGRTHCGMQCSRVLDCMKYTLNGSMCTLYKDVQFNPDINQQGASLWNRRRQLV